MIRAAAYLVIIVFANMANAQNSCRDQLVSCTQQTGDAFSCRSVYTNCMAAQGSDLGANSGNQNEGLTFRTDITMSGEALSSVRLFVTNPSSKPVQVSTATFPITCGDGSVDRAVFFMDFMVEGNVSDRSVGGEQVVCVGKGGAVASVDVSKPADGVGSMSPLLKYEFPCAGGEYRWVEVEYNDVGFFLWSNEDGAQGILNETFVGKPQFAELACTASKPADQTLVLKAKQTLLEWMRDPNPGELIYPRGATIGVRN